MSQYSELEELKAVFATRDLLVFESVDISERLGEEFDKGACFQKPTTVNEIEQRERVFFYPTISLGFKAPRLFT